MLLVPTSFMLLLVASYHFKTPLLSGCDLTLCAGFSLAYQWVSKLDFSLTSQVLPDRLITEQQDFQLLCSKLLSPRTSAVICFAATCKLLPLWAATSGAPAQNQ